ncbi:MAG: IMP cyclohydrolase [Planctomycetota bacterium]|jgi:phosphoribosylaminoimidazolecarboxamide formyltransferase/IMP cyclohydrolase|nr:IMP cyclohydrolase [Planctomycetota bacterium]
MPDLKSMYKTVMDDHFPEEMRISLGSITLSYRKRSWVMGDNPEEKVRKGLRYGENPGQEAALYELVDGNLELGGCSFIQPGNGLVSCLSEEGMLQFGKHPGKINLTDIDSALNALRYFEERPAAMIMKHNNPSGASYGVSAAEAYDRANAADRLAAFGGAVVFNVGVDQEAAELLGQNYLEVVAAPDFTGGALDCLKTRKNLRVIKIERLDRIRQYADRRFLDFKSLLDGGLIVQQSPLNRVRGAEDFLPAEWRGKDGTLVKVERGPTEQEKADLLFAWQIEQGVTSNSVLFVKNGTSVAIGAGEQDRVGVAEIAIFKAYKKKADDLSFRQFGCLFFELEAREKAGDAPRGSAAAVRRQAEEIKGGLIGSAAASDAFFPKRDGIDALAKQGVSAVIQPGGSLADREIIEAINQEKMTMVFTGQRAFKH